MASDSYDLVIVGSGIAGLYAALQGHERGKRVLIATKGSIDEASTRYAQGGIAAAVGPGDSPEAHLRDTIEAGAGLVDEAAARVLTAEAAGRIADLVRYGVRFDATDGEVALGREGAHSAPRILHAGGDATGLEIELSLSSLARREGVTILEHTLVERLVVGDGRVRGVGVFETRDATRATLEAEHVVLATGGAGQLYRVTTNPDVSTGDGVALAYACGAEVMDLEFTQFHPTALQLPDTPVFLISEALRGEGATLHNTRGERFMPRYHERAELAPRDVVARAEHREMAETGSDHVLLDITDRDATWLAARFPQIYRTCLEAGLDLSRDRIPVSPAAHYTMGWRAHQPRRARRRSPGSSPSAKWHAPACTARTAWRATRCWRRWYSPAAPSNESTDLGTAIRRRSRSRMSRRACRARCATVRRRTPRRCGR